MAGASPPAGLAPLVARLPKDVTGIFTTRWGGCSTGPYAELNLAAAVGDDPAAVGANRAANASWLGVDGVHFGRQVHGATVHVVGADPPGAEVTPTCDALVTNRPGVALGVLVADCVPVLLADPVAGVVAAAHAGRRGLVAGVLARCVAAMAAYGSEPTAVVAAIGPAVGGCCYEVPADLQAQVAGWVPQSVSTTRWGTPSLDLPRTAVTVLRGLGVRQVHREAVCTAEDERFYSYRRSGVTGRFAGVVVRR